MKHPILSTLIRKLWVTLLVPVVAEVYLFAIHLPHGIGNDVGFFHLGLPLFSYPFLFLIGLPVSLLSDAMTFKLPHTWRMTLALFIHAGGSFLFMTMFGPDMWRFFWAFVFPFSLIYWGLDEWFRRRKQRKVQNQDSARASQNGKK
jgi:hypothetical protein